MNDTTLTIILAAIPAIVASVAGLVVSLRNSTKADTNIRKAEEIHVLVNSNMTRVQADLAVANQRIGELEVIIGKLASSRDADIVERAKIHAPA